MGLFSKQPAYQPMPLAPLPQAIGLFPYYVARQETVIALKEKNFSIRDNYRVEDVNKNPVLVVQGKLLSIRHQKGVFRVDIDFGHEELITSLLSSP